MSCGIGQAEDMCSTFEGGDVGSASRSSPAPGGPEEHSIVTLEVLCQEREGNSIYLNFLHSCII